LSHLAGNDQIGCITSYITTSLNYSSVYILVIQLCRYAVETLCT